MKVGIVGAGLFGSIVAAAFAQRGAQVTVFDDRRPFAGSLAAGCLMKPGWYSSMGKDRYEPSLNLLKKLYSVRSINFSIAPLGHAHVDFIDPMDILFAQRENVQHMKAHVTSVDRDAGAIYYEYEGDRKEVFDLVVVAAGIWSEKLIGEDAPQKGLVGVSLLFEGETEPVIRPWAPFKQLVKFSIRPGVIWAGDGSAIISKNWTKEREQESVERVKQFVGLEPFNRIVGIRPYSKDNLVKKVGARTWVASGGAKNGTILAGWAAHLITTTEVPF